MCSSKFASKIYVDIDGMLINYVNYINTVDDLYNHQIIILLILYYNFFQNVSPDPTTSCGPYQPIEYGHSAEEYLQLYAQNKVDHDLHMDQSNSHDDDIVYSKDLDMDGDLEGDLAALNVDLNDVVHNHDTIGMVVLDDSGNLAGGTSTNGANHKVPG